MHPFHPKAAVVVHHHISSLQRSSLEVIRDKALFIKFIIISYHLQIETLQARSMMMHYCRLGMTGMHVRCWLAPPMLRFQPVSSCRRSRVSAPRACTPEGPLATPPE